MCLVVTWWERADLLALVCGVLLLVCYFPIGILGQVWYLIISIPDLCTLTYFYFKMEKFVECISNDKLRSELADSRLSAHNLYIRKGRHINVSRENRICRLCLMSMVESEFHFLLLCSCYSNMRRELLPSTAWPSVAIFITINATNSKCFFLNCQISFKSANTLRSQTLEDLAISC